jgi:hypothetical protein
MLSSTFEERMRITCASLLPNLILFLRAITLLYRQSHGLSIHILKIIQLI